jgi:hypothetical protein
MEHDMETPETVQAGLERAGDTLRTSRPLSDDDRLWLSNITPLQVGRAIKLAAEEVEAFALSKTVDDCLPFLLRRRDAVESLQVAIIYWATAHNFLPARIEGYLDLINTLDAFSSRLRAFVSRAEVEALLGDRAYLPGAGATPWTVTLDPPGPTLEDWNYAMMLTIAPSDEIVTRYVVSGYLAEYVEALANRNSYFAEELTSVIDSTLAAKEEVGRAAQAWRFR